MTAAEWIVEFLKSCGVARVYELSGGMITPLLDSCAGKIDLIDVRHEQAAGFAAEAEARITGIPGVALATSGPGAVNLLTAIGSAYFDSTPMVFITGQVPILDLCEVATARRQAGFQETNIVAMAHPITKGAWQLMTALDVIQRLPLAWDLAMRDRPGPVLLDIPFDVQRQEVGSIGIPPVLSREPRSISKMLLDRVKTALEKAQRPIVLVGGGCAAPATRDRVRNALDRLQVPVVSSLMGLDVTKLSVGMIGVYGNRWANRALIDSDLVLVLGSRLDSRQTGDLRAWEGKEIIHVDVDPRELGSRIPGMLINSDVGDFCNALAKIGSFRRPKWEWQISVWAEEWHDETELKCNGINPNALMKDLAYSAIQAHAVTVDVGAHQMWAAQSFITAARQDQRLLTSGGMGAMGWALPAAVGAALARPGPVLCITGDAGLQVNLQELQTIAERRLPVKIVVMNNSGHGMVRQFQREVFESRYAGTCPTAPSFASIAASYGIGSRRIDRPESIEDALGWLWSDDRSLLLEVMIDPATGIAPKARFGHGLDEMDPPR